MAGIATAIFERSDLGIRTQRLQALVTGDFDALERGLVDEFLTFTGRLDHVALAVAALADQRVGTATGSLDRLIGYTDERSILLVSSQARRLRGPAPAGRNRPARRARGVRARWRRDRTSRERRARSAC